MLPCRTPNALLGLLLGASLAAQHSGPAATAPPATLALLLRDPELPAELLPTLWPGEQARSLCRTLYQRLLPDSEAYLDQQLQLANGSVPSATHLLAQRFRPN